VKVIILAAGRGSRMKELTDILPKCLTAYRGKPLINHCIDVLKAIFSPSDLVIIGGYRFDTLKHLGIDLIENKEWETTNIIGSLASATTYLRSEDCLVVYSDIFFTEEAIYQMIQAETPAVLSVSRWLEIWKSRFEEPLEDLESFQISENGAKLTEIGKKPKNLSEIQGQFGGIFKLNPKIWKQIESEFEELKFMDTTTLIQKCLEHSIVFNVVKYDGEWAELDTRTDLETQE
jgi:choline kinase